VLAALLLVMIENGILINRIDPFWVEFLMGAFILIAVILGRVNRGSFSLRRFRQVVRTGS
jgi:ribose/xylose/arabinose/galactoside ABC-type transport system permease subunit